MNIKRIVLGLVGTAALHSSLALAAPAVLVGSGNGLAGSGTPVNITVNWDGTAAVVGAQFQILYDSTNLTPDITNACTSANWACSNNTPGIIQFVSNIVVSGIPDELIGTIAFNVAAAAPGTYPLTVADQQFGDINEQPVAPSGTQNGQINVNAGPPDAQFSPIPGTTITLGPVAQGGIDPTNSVDVENVGATGSELDVNCIETSDPGNVFSLSTASVNNLLTTDPPHTITVTCDSAAAPNTYTGTMSCTHNGSGATHTSPANFPLSCTITAGPQPAYASSPIGPGQAFNFGSVAKNSTPPEVSTTIDNSGDPDTTLDGSCSITTNPGNVFSFTAGGGAYSVPTAGPNHTVTVACDTATAGTFNGTLSCSHDGGNIASPATYPLSCTVTGLPKYNSLPAPGATLSFGGATEQGDEPDPTDTVTINNSGDAGSQLDVTCTESSDPSNVFSVTNGVINDLLPTQGTRVVTVTCDSAAQGNYSGELSCVHNGEAPPASPALYDLFCEIGPPGAAVFDSDPDPGSLIDLTPEDVPVGSPPPTGSLTFFNLADPGDSDLAIDCELLGDTSEINVIGAVTNITLPPGEQHQIQFSCETEEPGDFLVEVNCNYDTTPEPPAGTPQGLPGASYDVTCGVREAESAVESDPPDGTQQTQFVEQGGSAQFQVIFSEVNNEGEDGAVTCSLDDGTNFEIISAYGQNNPVPAGGMFIFTIEGTDPQDGSEVINDTLLCTVSDSASPTGRQESFPLQLVIGGELAQFEVNKTFTDGNPAEVWVTIDCNTGLPLEQNKLISEGNNVVFVVGDFDSGEMNCSVFEAPVPGYSPDYTVSGDSSSEAIDTGEDAGCHFTAVSGGDVNVCDIVNSPDPVDVTITKEWIIEGNASGVDTRYTLVLVCNAEIVDGSEYCQSTVDLGVQVPQGNGTYWCETFYGDDSEIFHADVIPGYPSSSCYVEEFVFDAAVEVENGCGNLVISAGEGDSCTITNTVFFEGIPTLSPFGLAVLALLMLGVGFVAVRRLV